MLHRLLSENSFKSLKKMLKSSTARWMVMNLKGQVLAVKVLRKRTAEALAQPNETSHHWNISAVSLQGLTLVSVLNWKHAEFFSNFAEIARSGLLRDQTKANSCLLSVDHAELAELQIYIVGICFPCQGGNYFRLTSDFKFHTHVYAWSRRLWKHQRNLLTCGGLRTPRTAMSLSPDSFISSD